MSQTVPQRPTENIGFTVSPWPWTLRQAGKPHNPVYYIRDRFDAEVVRIDGPDARERAELFMEMAAQFHHHLSDLNYKQKYGLPVKQLV